jgi:hypothetical protein
MTPTDEQVEAALVAFDEAIADGLSKPRALELALTAAFSLSAPAGTVEVRPRSRDFRALTRDAIATVLALDDYTNVNETEFTGWGDGDVPPAATFWRVKSGQALKALMELPEARPLLDAIRANALASFDAAEATALLPSQPSAALPGKDAVDLHDFTTHREAWRDGLLLALSSSRPANEDTDDRSYWKHEIDVFDAAMLALDAALVSQPQPEGEVVAWRFRSAYDDSWQVTPVPLSYPYDESWKARHPEAEPLYLHPAPTLQGAGLIEALEELVDSLASVEHVPPKDPAYGDEVKEIGKRIGFGALMAAASHEWRAWLAENGYPLGSEFVAGPCRMVLVSDLRRARAALSPQRGAWK